MSQPTYRVVVLDTKVHVRKNFDSGNQDLDHYFHTQVGQDIKKRVTACYVAVTPQNEVAGYYTLAPFSVVLDEVPQPQKGKLPSYPAVPVYRLGRLAVGASLQGQGLGGVLLADALSRAAAFEAPGYALVVDAIDANAAAFYQHFGFIPFLTLPMSLFLPLASIPGGKK